MVEILEWSTQMNYCFDGCLYVIDRSGVGFGEILSHLDVYFWWEKVTLILLSDFWKIQTPLTFLFIS